MDNFIECPICKKTLADPVFLPCGHTICKSHVTEEIKKDKGLVKMTCPTCNSEHDVSKQGFPTNFIAQNLIKYKLNKLDLGGEHTVAVESFKDLK